MAGIFLLIAPDNSMTGFANKGRLVWRVERSRKPLPMVKKQNSRTMTTWWIEDIIICRFRSYQKAGWFWALKSMMELQNCTMWANFLVLRKKRQAHHNFWAECHESHGVQKHKKYTSLPASLCSLISPTKCSLPLFSCVYLLFVGLHQRTNINSVNGNWSKLQTASFR